MIVDSFSDKDMVAAVKPAKLVTLFANSLATIFRQSFLLFKIM